MLPFHVTDEEVNVEWGCNTDLFRNTHQILSESHTSNKNTDNENKGILLLELSGQTLAKC